MTLIGAALPILLSALAPASPQRVAPAPDSAALVRRIAATATLAAQEYRIGVVDGRVVAAAEVEEARLFLQEARRVAGGLTSAAPAPAAALDSLLTLVQSLAPADTLDARVRALCGRSRRAVRRVAGRGAGPPAGPGPRRGAVSRPAAPAATATWGAATARWLAGLDPAPANLADWTALRDQSPLDFYRRVSIGVVGHRDAGVRGAAVPRGPVGRRALCLDAAASPLRPGSPPSCPASRTTGRMSDAALLDTLGAPVDGSAGGLRPPRRGPVAAADRLRGGRSPRAGPRRSGLGLCPGPDRQSRRRRSRAQRLHDLRAGRARAARQGRRPRGRAGGRLRRAPGRRDPGSGPELDAARLRLTRAARPRRPRAGRGTSPANLFVQSFVIMLREGLEAILIVGALMTFLAKMGAARPPAPSQRGDPRRDRGEPAHRGGPGDRVPASRPPTRRRSRA